MLSVAHAATGAFIAVKLENPVLAIPLILLSHYLEDLVAHWDAGTGLGRGLKTIRQAFWHELVDLALTTIIVVWFFDPSLSIIHQPSTIAMAPYWGAILGLLPDFLEAPRNFFKYEPRWLKPLNHFHARFHHSIPDPIAGLAPQILLLIALFFLK